MLTGVSVTPPSATLANAGSQSFSATGLDQFGDTMTASVNWTLDAGSIGTLQSATPTSVIYKAPASGTGNATVRATSGTLTATAAVTVSNTIPGVKAEFFDFTTALSAVPNFTGLVANVTRTDTQINYPNVGTAWPGVDSRFVDTFASRGHQFH